MSRNIYSKDSIAVYSKTFYEWVFTREFDNFLNLTNYELNAFIQSVGIPEIPRE